jgi:hypothetical protein
VENEIPARLLSVANTPVCRQKPIEIGALCVFLSSPAGNHITGTIVAHDGGLLLISLNEMGNIIPNPHELSIMSQCFPFIMGTRYTKALPIGICMYYSQRSLNSEPAVAQ